MPEPQRKQGEPEDSYRSRLIRHYINRGYPRDQAAAIAYSRTRKKRRSRRGARR